MLNIVWEYVVKEGREAEFEKRYAAGGLWGQLFGQASQYRGTVLLRDRQTPRRYFTIDTWDDMESYEAFRAEFVKEYNALDSEFEALTESERRVGFLDVLSAGSGAAAK